LFGCLSICPIIGTVPAKDGFKKLPIQMMIAMGFINITGTLFTGTGLGDALGTLIGPLVNGVGPLGFSIIASLLLGIMVNIFVNAQTGAYALVLGVLSPVCVSLGYNPVLIMLPVMFVGSFFFCMGPSAMCMLNKGYGYWEMKDPMLPGYLVVIFASVLFPVICYYVGPIFGMPVYLETAALAETIPAVLPTIMP
ncbi:MAG: hypothetical protein Q4D04_09985, partial [Clostridia bacterium]|nr:hypothetical protein [Clostridia bacterium]